jgi:hypothetical protein
MKQAKPNKTANVQLRDIRTNGATQMRAGIDEEHVERLCHAIEEGIELPPLDVFEDERNVIWLADGFHRYHAYRKSAFGTVAVNIYYGSKRDAIVFAAGANADHGLPRTRDDKRRAVQALLNDRDWKDKSDREIAKQARVSHSFASTIRHEINGTTAAPRNGNVATQASDRTVEPKAVSPKSAKPSNDLAAERIQTFADCGPAPEVGEPAEPVKAEPDADAVPEHVTEALQTKSRAQSFKIALSKLFDDYLDMCRGPGGAWYGGHRPAIEAACDQIKGEIEAAVPYGVCPYCEGDGCEKCRNTGVMPKLVHHNATSVLNRFGKATT